MSYSFLLHIEFAILLIPVASIGWIMFLNLAYKNYDQLEKLSQRKLKAKKDMPAADRRLAVFLV
jgi:hypothetical protein